MMMIDNFLIYYSDKYIYVNITHTHKYVLIIHYTQPNKAYQSLVANTYKLIVLQISKHPIFIAELIDRVIHKLSNKPIICMNNYVEFLPS